MGTLRQLKTALSRDKDLRGLLVRSGRSEILLDLDGDRSPDIGLMDVNRDGDIDAIAVDLTGNGEFNFYLADNDGNGIPDEVSFYRDGDDIPVHSEFGRVVEAEMLDSAAKILAAVPRWALIPRPTTAKSATSRSISTLSGEQVVSSSLIIACSRASNSSL